MSWLTPHPTHPSVLDGVLEVDCCCQPHVHSNCISCNDHLHPTAACRHESRPLPSGPSSAEKLINYLQHSYGVPWLHRYALQLLLCLSDHILKKKTKKPSRVGIKADRCVSSSIKGFCNAYSPCLLGWCAQRPLLAGQLEAPCLFWLVGQCILYMLVHSTWHSLLGLLRPAGHPTHLNHLGFMLWLGPGALAEAIRLVQQAEIKVATSTDYKDPRCPVTAPKLRSLFFDQVAKAPETTRRVAWTDSLKKELQ